MKTLKNVLVQKNFQQKYFSFFFNGYFSIFLSKRPLKTSKLKYMKIKEEKRKKKRNGFGNNIKYWAKESIEIR